jgi:hypothetical protein
MLQFGPDLHLNQSAADLDDQVNGAIAVAWPLTSIHYGCPGKDRTDEFNHPVLLRDVTDNDPASGDILKLAQTDALALQLLYDRNCGLDPNAGLQPQIAESLNDDLLSIVKRSPECIQRFNVFRQRFALSQAVS